MSMVQKYQKCPNCQIYWKRIDEENYFFCQCGTYFCYVCGNPLQTDPCRLNKNLQDHSRMRKLFSDIQLAKCNADATPLDKFKLKMLGVFLLLLKLPILIICWNTFPSASQIDQILLYLFEETEVMFNESVGNCLERFVTIFNWCLNFPKKRIENELPSLNPNYEAKAQKKSVYQDINEYTIRQALNENITGQEKNYKSKFINKNGLYEMSSLPVSISSKNKSSNEKYKKQAVPWH